MANASLLVAIITGLAATLLWDSTLLLPCKLLVVLVHEMWHGFVAMLAGAKLKTISLAAGESGSTLVTGLGAGWGFAASVSAGYLGSALTGALLLNRGLAHSMERITLAGFALWLWYMSTLFTDTGSTAFWTGMGWAAAALAVTISGRIPSRLLLVIVGTLFLWYCVYDLFDFSRDLDRSDAGILSRHLVHQGWALPGQSLALTIVAVWIAGMIAITGLFLLPALLPRTATPVSSPEAGNAPPPLQNPGGPQNVLGFLDASGQPGAGNQTGQGPPMPDFGFPAGELPPDLAMRLAELDAALAAADGMELPAGPSSNASFMSHGRPS